jgi:hypothetical protein
LDAEPEEVEPCRCRIGHPPHAAWAYSWISPPSRSRRWSRRLAGGVGWGSGVRGAAWCSVRWGRWEFVVGPTMVADTRSLRADIYACCRTAWRSPSTPSCLRMIEPSG